MSSIYHHRFSHSSSSLSSSSSSLSSLFKLSSSFSSFILILFSFLFFISFYPQLALSQTTTLNASEILNITVAAGQPNFLSTPFELWGDSVSDSTYPIGLYTFIFSIGINEGTVGAVWIQAPPDNIAAQSSGAAGVFQPLPQAAWLNLGSLDMEFAGGTQPYQPALIPYSDNIPEVLLSVPIIWYGYLNLSSLYAGSYSGYIQVWMTTDTSISSANYNYSQFTISVNVLVGVRTKLVQTPVILANDTNYSANYTYPVELNPTGVFTTQSIFILEGNTILTNFSLRTMPHGTVTINIYANLQLGDFQGFTPAGKPWRGGGPGMCISCAIGCSNSPAINVSFISITFDTDNWDIPIPVYLSALYTPYINGDRWATITYNMTSESDSDYASFILSNPFPTTNFTIKEMNYANITFSQTFWAVKETAPVQNLTVAITSSPFYPVTLSFTSTYHYSFSPASIVYDNVTWSSPLVIAVTIIDNSVIEGFLSLTNVWPTPLSSEDYDYQGLTLPTVVFNITDMSNSFTEIDPTFGYITGITYTVISYPYPVTFNPISVGHSNLPTGLICLFDDDTNDVHFNTTALIIAPSQVRCNTTNQTGEAQTKGKDYLAFAVTLLMNGAASLNPTPVLFSMGMSEEYDLTDSINSGEPTYDTNAPRITCVTPSEIDTNSNSYITLYGLNFHAPGATDIGSGILDNFQYLSCSIGGVVSTQAYVINLDPLSTSTCGGAVFSSANGGQTNAIVCSVAARPYLSAYPNSVALAVAISLDGQVWFPRLAEDGHQDAVTQYVNMYDYDSARINTTMLGFYAACVFVAVWFLLMLLQSLFCKRVPYVAPVILEKSLTGPQALIEFLEPIVKSQEQKYNELEREEKIKYLIDHQRELEDAKQKEQKLRLQELRDQELAKMEAEKQAKAEKRAAKRTNTKQASKLDMGIIDEEADPNDNDAFDEQQQAPLYKTMTSQNEEEVLILRTNTASQIKQNNNNKKPITVLRTASSQQMSSSEQLTTPSAANANDSITIHSNSSKHDAAAAAGTNSSKGSSKGGASIKKSNTITKENDATTATLDKKDAPTLSLAPSADETKKEKDKEKEEKPKDIEMAAVDKAASAAPAAADATKEKEKEKKTHRSKTSHSHKDKEKDREKDKEKDKDKEEKPKTHRASSKKDKDKEHDKDKEKEKDDAKPAIEKKKSSIKHKELKDKDKEKTKDEDGTKSSHKKKSSHKDKEKDKDKDREKDKEKDKNEKDKDKKHSKKKSSHKKDKEKEEK